MKNFLLNNHKIQAFYFSFLCFLPLFFLLFNSLFIFKNDFQNEVNYVLDIRQIHYFSKNTTIQPEKVETIAKKDEKIIHHKNTQVKNNINISKNKILKNNINLNPITSTQVANEINNHTRVVKNTPIETTIKPSFLKAINQAISKVQIYPKKAIKMHLEGIVMVEFLWNQDKTLSELKIIKSSGYKILDESALKTIKLASINFPSYDKNVRISIPINYTLTSR